MANEIDLYKDLDRAEKFLEWCIKYKEKQSTINTAKETIKYITNQIKTNYPELIWSK